MASKSCAFAVTTYETGTPALKLPTFVLSRLRFDSAAIETSGAKSKGQPEMKREIVIEEGAPNLRQLRQARRYWNRSLATGSKRPQWTLMEPRISIITLGVSDLPRSIRFYRDGLGFPTNVKESDGIAFFTTGGTRLALYPLEKLAADIAPDARAAGGFGGITLAHNVRRKEEVAAVLALAEKAGGKIVKQAQDVFWGGHGGYFADADGYYWEVAWAPNFTFDEAGNLII